MIYGYSCPCGEKIDAWFEMGKAPKTVKCSCGKRAKRDYTASRGGFLLKGGGWPGKELSMGEVISNEKKRDQEFKRRRKELRQEGAPLPYWGDE